MAVHNEKTHAPWQREFFKNITIFEQYGVPRAEAQDLLTHFLELSAKTPRPDFMQVFQDKSALERVGVHNRQNAQLRDFMLRFLKPLTTNFKVQGLANAPQILALARKFPVVFVSNHMSHMDAVGIYTLLYQAGGAARVLADKLVFIAGRLAFEADVGCLGAYMFDTLLVCSRVDMQDNPALADLMTRINMRSFRKAQQLHKEGKIITIFPEGTRSRTGKLLKFVDSAYHFVNNKIIVPFSLEGTDAILPPESFLFCAAAGRIYIGKPILVGKLAPKQMQALPRDVDQLVIPDVVDPRQYVLDNLALLIGSHLHHHRHGSYRNLYQSVPNGVNENRLIQRRHKPNERITIIGHSGIGTAIAAVLANQDANIQIYIIDAEKEKTYNQQRGDLQHFPLFKLPPNINFVSNVELLADTTLWLQAALPWELDAYFTQLKDMLAHKSVPIISIMKGCMGPPFQLILEYLTNTFQLMPDYMGVLAGANHSHQIIERKYVGFEMAAYNTLLVKRLLPLFNTGYVATRAAVNPDDVTGVQLGGALRSIYAIGIGLIDGYYHMSLGGNNDNSLFHLFNPFFAELRRLGIELGGRPSTFFGLAGLSDFMLSCFAQDSRERQYGFDYMQKQMSAPNSTVAKAAQESEAAMRYRWLNLRLLADFIQERAENYPVASAIYAIMRNGANASKSLEKLIRRLEH